MATSNQISAQIAIAQAYYVQLMDLDTANLQQGYPATNHKKIICLKRLIKALQWDLAINVNDDVTSVIYSLLVEQTGLYNGNAAVVDPSVVIPGMTINVTKTGSVVNSTKIAFVDQTVITLASYNTFYKPLYGNNPIVAIFTPGYTQDEQTPPVIIYQDNDITKDILSITWTYPVPTSGYVQISGTPN